MKPIITHSWSLNKAEALALQQRMATEVIKDDRLNTINQVAGVDVAYAQEDERLIAAVVVLDSNSLQLIEKVTAEDKVQFPYIPGLFSFRELPSIIKAFAKLRHSPDLVICDGQGYAHPRRFGLACHLGVIFDVPTIGCGKTRLLGKHETCPIERGATAPLHDGNEIIGQALRTQSGVNPIYVSIGHRISLETACDWILKLTPKYRLPETIRQADQAVRTAIKNI